jgi:hypothetical protein
MSGHLGTIKKATPTATRRPTLRDLEWAAGFLEGEGSIDRNGNPPHGVECIKGTQIQRAPLERLSGCFGGRIYARLTPGKRRIYVWQATGARARGIMLTLFVLMSPRRKAQIRRAFQPGSYGERFEW